MRKFMIPSSVSSTIRQQAMVRGNEAERELIEVTACSASWERT